MSNILFLTINFPINKEPTADVLRHIHIHDPWLLQSYKEDGWTAPTGV